MSDNADIKIRIAGKEYDLEFEKLTMGDRRDIKRLAGYGAPDEWIDGLMKGDIDAIAALAFVCKKRAGEGVTVDNFWPLFERVSGTDGVQLITPDDEDEDPKDGDGSGSMETTPEPSGNPSTDTSSG